MTLTRSAAEERLDAATVGLDAPFALVDLDAFDVNAADMARRAGGMPIRVASKSIRVRSCSNGRCPARLRGRATFTAPGSHLACGVGTSDATSSWATPASTERR